MRYGSENKQAPNDQKGVGQDCSYLIEKPQRYCQQDKYQQLSCEVLENCELFVRGLLFASGGPKFGGSHARVNFEGMSKMALVIESGGRRNVGNGLA